MSLLTLRETYALNRLSSFKNLRRKGGKFDHRPGRPKVLLRHCFYRLDETRGGEFSQLFAAERIVRAKYYRRRRRIISMKKILQHTIYKGHLRCDLESRRGSELNPVKQAHRPTGRLTGHVIPVLTPVILRHSSLIFPL